MKSLHLKLLLAPLIGALILGVAGRVGLGASTQAATSQPTHSAAPVKIVSISGLGRVLVNRHGMTLYYFKLDRAGHSACTGDCARAWPPLLISKKSSLRRLRLPGKVGTIRRGHRFQITYNGWPLYTFVGDKHPGDAKGQGVLGTWFVAKPGLASAPAIAPSPTPTSTPTPSPSPTPTSTPTSLPTAVPAPTSTAAPTDTPTATPTPRPTATNTPVATVPPRPSPTPTRSATPTPQPTSCIPQGGGGDQDGDNSGAPSDGDGCQ